MQTRLSRICDAIIEAGWLTILVVTPLFFNTLTSRVFEPDKIHLLRSIVLVMGVAWAVQVVDGGLRREPGAPGLWGMIRGTPLILPALALTGAYLLSTILSIVPRISLLGSYVRSQGLYTFLCYIALFFMVLTHLRRRAQVDRLSYAVIVASLPIALYAVIQHFGLDPLPWGGDVRQRAAANLGNAIFLAAYLIMAFFVTLDRLARSAAQLMREEKGTATRALQTGVYLFVLTMQFIAIVFTQSRGPWLGLAAGLYVFALVAIWLAGRRAAANPDAAGRLRGGAKPLWAGLVGLTGAALLFLVVANLPQGPFAGVRDQPYIGRIATMLDTGAGTNAVRVLIWEGVTDMMLKPHAPIAGPDGTADALNAIRPLVGYGPESMWVAYNRFYPPELAYYEARNASPDRAHNETFDALVRTGAIGFAAQLYLFGSIFYYALRWLGLIPTRGRRTLFFGLTAGGALLGVLIPWIADGSLRLAGIGLPAGLVAGMLLYITIAAYPGSQAGAPDAAPADGDRLLILAAFAAIVAFFVEVHFGIAIVSTLALFWILAALLAVVGMGWIREETPSAEAAPAPRSQPAAAAKRGKRATRAERRAQTAQAEVGATISKPNVPDLLRAFLPFAAVLAVVTLTLTYSFMVNQTGSEGAFGILWGAFTQRIDRATFDVVFSPAILMLLVLTWLAGGWLALTESAGQAGDGRRRGWAVAAVYLAATAGVFVVYGLIQGTRMLASGLEGLEVLRRVAAHVVFFDVCLLLLMAALAAGLRAADPMPRPTRWTARPPALALGAGVVLGAVALFVIYRVNIRPIQADTYYKQGQAYESAGAWEGAIVLYREAAGLQPGEDYYDLFLGRALLQLATMTGAGGNAVLPEDVAGMSAGELLAVVDQGMRSQTREDLLRATNAALSAARQANPLNTDHSANLGRLYRSWAFADVRGSGQAASNQLLRELTQAGTEPVDRGKLEQAARFYEEAVQLSPQNAQLYNELAAVQYILGDDAAALTTLDRSLALDPRFSQTHLLRGDALAALGNKAAALEAYRQAAEIAPQDLNIQSAIGVISAELGQTDGALAAFQRILNADAGTLAAAETELSGLDAQAEAAGGYDRMPMAGRERRDLLAAQIAESRSQLHLTYRNMALVLREAGRIDEALAAAQQALTLANDAQRATIESLIADMQNGRGE